MKQAYVYIMASHKNGTLYIGILSKLVPRIWQHKDKKIEGFTKKHNVRLLVYFEQCQCIKTAILREKTLKKWRRSGKLELIEKHNPEWLDLWESIL